VARSKSKQDLKSLLDEWVARYNTPDFIADDPISIPHFFTVKQDIEIMGFWAATLAWGQRKTIIAKSKELIARMDHRPYEFIRHHSDQELKGIQGFVHRTFNDTDALYFIDFFKRWYGEHDSLEQAFTQGMQKNDETVEQGINQFRKIVFDSPYAPLRTGKHIASPDRKSACKRINMFLRWMVRQDSNGVDFGLWKTIKPSQLVCPLDVHVERVSKQLGLLTRKPTDWQAALELTAVLKTYDPKDPVKYDFALFGMGIENKYSV
jgi:uncharacterized protein (TIGR02757 family)